MPEPTPAGNAANAPGAVVSTTPHRGAVAAQRARAGRGETLALIESGRADPAAAKPSTAKPADGAPAEKPAPRTAPAPTTEEPADDRREAQTQAPPETSTAPDVSSVADPETAKRVATINASEKRSRDKIAAERKELEERAKAIETEWSPRAKAAQDFEALKAKAAKARSNPAHLVELFSALGYGDEHFAPTAQALYALSKAGQADPAHKAHAEKLLRDRESVDDVAALRREIQELKQGLTQKDQQTEFQRLQGDFLDGTVKAIGETAPTVKAMASKGKNQQKLRDALWRHTVELTHEQDGEAPDFAAVVARYQTELDEMGVPRPSAQAAPETKPNNETADKQNPARTLSNDLSTPRVPRTAQGGDENRRSNRKETLRMLESGKLE